jgi:pseudouridine-5'-phosphate glycosidase
MPHLPQVALESTVISHGLPYPHNLELATEMEAIVRQHGAEPRTIGIIGGELIAGLSGSQIEHLATARDVRKVSRRDLPIVVARRLDGATTVATTMWIAHRAGIEVFATGGIGGVHRGVEDGPSSDISADLQELAQTPVIVVCAGAKAILDLPATLEYLETHGVTVVAIRVGCVWMCAVIRRRMWRRSGAPNGRWDCPAACLSLSPFRRRRRSQRRRSSQ